MEKTLYRDDLAGLKAWTCLKMATWGDGPDADEIFLLQSKEHPSIGILLYDRKHSTLTDVRVRKASGKTTMVSATCVCDSCLTRTSGAIDLLAGVAKENSISYVVTRHRHGTPFKEASPRVCQLFDWKHEHSLSVE